MEDLFRSYWWLIFPVGYGLIAAYNSLLNYLRQREMLRLIRTYAEKGQEPPESLLKALDRPLDAEAAMWGAASGGGERPANYWSLFGLFAALSGGFIGAHYFTDMGRGTDAFLVVGMVMGAVAVWAVIAALTDRGRKS